MPRKTTKRKTARRKRTSRLARFKPRAKSGALGLGRSASNIVAGAALYEAANRVMPNRFGSYQLPANMIAAGFAGQVLFKGGQKDLITAGTKILTRRVAVNMILPKLSGLSAGNGGQIQTARAQGGF